MTYEAAPASEQDLDEILSRPTPAVLDALRKLPGDVLILGVSGKMGPTLARMYRRGLDELGRSDRVIGVARFSKQAAEAALREDGIETLRCDLLDREAVRKLPDSANIIFMTGTKFGTTSTPSRTWVVNTYVPAIVAERFTKSRKLVFSTGCVYADTPVSYGGSREEDPLEPIGEYSNSCVGRERMFEHFARKYNNPLAVYRLNYSVDLRYGVLVDVAQKVYNGAPVDVTTSHVNVIWQGDASRYAIQCLSEASNPPLVMNVTGPEIISIRDLAQRFGVLFGRAPILVGQEGERVLLSNATECHKRFGLPDVSADTMVRWVAEWMSRGGHMLGKPTCYEARDGKY